MKNMFILHARRVHVRILVPSWTNPNQHVVVLRYHGSSFRHDQSLWRPCDELKWISNGGLQPTYMFGVSLNVFVLTTTFGIPSLLFVKTTLETSKLLHYRSPSELLCGDMYSGHVTTLLPISQSGFDHQHAREVRLLLQSMGSQGWHWDWETLVLEKSRRNGFRMQRVPCD